MEKRAVTSTPLLDSLERRWSPRAFRTTPIPKEKLLEICEAARWAPSAYNEQPWRFMVALEGTPHFVPMLACLVKQNQVWAKNAGALVAGLTKKNFSHETKPNRWNQHDLGLAVENMMLQAVETGLFAHPMAGFSPKKVTETFEVPEEYEPLVMIALGYPGELEELSPELQNQEKKIRQRKPLEELFFEEKWGKPFL